MSFVFGRFRALEAIRMFLCRNEVRPEIYARRWSLDYNNDVFYALNTLYIRAEICEV